MPPITEAPGGLGHALTPEQWSDFVLTALTAASVTIASGATVVRTTERVVHIPRVTGNGGVGWYAELDPIGPGDPVGNELVLKPFKCAAISTLSNESVSDSTASALDAVGAAMVRAIGLEVDRAYFAGTGAANDQPTGILTLAGLPKHIGTVDYPSIVTAAGVVRAAGGQPDSLFINPADHVALQLATDGFDRPLIQPDAQQGPSQSIAGLRVWPSPAVPAGSALIAEASQVIVCLRQDATVAVSDQANFGSDSTLARVICRTDVGVNDLNGLCQIAAAGTQSAKSSKA